MKILCGSKGGKVGVFAVEVEEGGSVGDLLAAITAPPSNRFEKQKLRLYLAKKNDKTWMAEAEISDFTRLEQLRDLHAKLRDIGLSSKEVSTNMELNEGAESGVVVHVLVVPEEECIQTSPPSSVLGVRSIEEVESPKGNDALSMPQFKKPRVDMTYVEYQGPLSQNAFSVPAESISAYNQIKEGFAKDEGNRPLFLLYGPPQFGKTTTGYSIRDWIAGDANAADVKCVYFEVNPLDTENEETFWRPLGKIFDGQSACHDCESFTQVATQNHKRFCLILDDLDTLFTNKSLAVSFFGALRKWKQSPVFYGFLGIGSRELVHHYELFDDMDASSPFTSSDLIAATRFTPGQMTDFFKLIEHRYMIAEEVKAEMIKYCNGVPGAFGSMLRFTIDNGKWNLELEPWLRWFKLSPFDVYLSNYNHVYSRVKEHLAGTPESDLEWQALKQVMFYGGELTASDVETACGVPVRGDNERRLIDPLLKMGIVDLLSNGKLKIMSSMMHRVCMEGIPERKFF